MKPCERTGVGKLASSEWITRPRPVQQPRLRLFCLPHAGGGVSVFGRWPARLPEKIEVCAVQLPGRESRINDCRYESLDAVVQVLAGHMRPWLDVPFALFGHELGALIAFELTRQLWRVKGPTPARLCVAGCAAPHLMPRKPFIHQLPNAAFLDGLNDRPCAMADAVRSSPALLARLLPVLRSDLAMLETYTFRPGDRLDVPITAFGGSDDRTVSAEALAAWAEHTGTFSQQVLPGDQFFLRSAEDRVLAAIDHQLKPDYQ